MNFLDILLLAIGLAADAFAVSVVRGLITKKKYLITGLVCGLWFGLFQALMPYLGFILGSNFEKQLSKYSDYIAFGLLSFLGIKMIVEAIKEKNATESEKKGENPLGFIVMFTLAIATSIDALAAGVTLAASSVNIYFAISIIGLVSFILSFIGAVIGAKIGSKSSFYAEIIGGIILVFLGVKMLFGF